ncbi:MAG: hypothetical protein R3236_02080 [Phycisphaeraceae bacterium]|nr:hypothetical protein [Phycisphaeraceae bacterium]
MPLQMQMRTVGDRLEVAITGEGAIEPLLEQVDSILLRCETEGLKRVLIDFREAQFPYGTIERYQVGSQGGRFAAASVRVATVHRPDQVDPDRFGLTVARNRGAAVQMFTDPDRAAAWLDAPLD